MKTLYVYKINEDTGKIEKHVIEKYKESPSGYHYEYCFTGKFTGSFVAYKKNLDLIVNGKLHTFNPDEHRAKSKILSYLMDKRDKARDEYIKWGRLFDNVFDSESKIGE
jgi:hypothetical protein